MHPLIRRTHVPFAVFCAGFFLLGWMTLELAQGR